MIENCPMRHENGNCIPAGGFCTANKNICVALFNAYRMGKEGTTSDLISRQAAIDALDFEIVHMTAYCDGKNEGNPLAQYNKGLEDGKKAIEALPPAQPEPQEGRFERKQDGVFCSVCHYGWEFITGVPAEVEREYHYCPNCGADMRGEQDG